MLLLALTIPVLVTASAIPEAPHSAPPKLQGRVLPSSSIYNASGPPPLTNSSNTYILLPPTLPSYAEPLDPHLAAFSIELDQWPLWAGEGVGKVNQFTYNIMENLGNRTGRGVHVRIGGE